MRAAELRPDNDYYIVSRDILCHTEITESAETYNLAKRYSAVSLLQSVRVDSDRLYSYDLGTQSTFIPSLLANSFNASADPHRVREAEIATSQFFDLKYRQLDSTIFLVSPPGATHIICPLYSKVSGVSLSGCGMEEIDFSAVRSNSFSIFNVADLPQLAWPYNPIIRIAYLNLIKSQQIPTLNTIFQIRD